MPDYPPYEPPPERRPEAQPPWGPPPPAFGGYGMPAAPYGLDPVTGLPLSDKSKATAGLLQLLLPLVGLAGVGRLYSGSMAIGLCQLLGVIVSYVLICVFVGAFAAPCFLVWSIVDGIVILASAAPRDGLGRVMR